MFDYKLILPAFVANGNPSEDTIRKYTTEIDNWLAWCEGNAIDPLKAEEVDARIYQRWLVDQKYSTASVALKIAAARSFYNITTRLKLTNINPFESVKAKQPTYDDTDFDYLDTEEIAEICTAIRRSNNPVSKRNLAIIILMAVEGLRTVEVHRMSDEDINFERGSIFVHGKSRDEFIYPCQDTLDILREYINCRRHPIKDDAGTPTFISFSSKYEGCRITRTGIRWAVNNILLATGKKPRNGSSCHMLRHSCGTNLYKETKDLRLVQETLRQRNPTTAARYTHVTERVTDRKTSKIFPNLNDENNNG